MNSEPSIFTPELSRRDFLQQASVTALAVGALPEYVLGTDMGNEEASALPLWDLAQKSKDMLTLTV
jgi:hypothetical protein